ncbi:MAG: hypothetical protein AAF447_23250 [Myxococcota bacterium]
MATPTLETAVLHACGRPCCTLQGRFRAVFPKDARGGPGAVRSAFRGFVSEGALPACLPALAAAMRACGDDDGALAPLLAELREEALALRLGVATHRVLDASFSDDVWTLVLER